MDKLEPHQHFLLKGNVSNTRKLCHKHFCFYCTVMEKNNKDVQIKTSMPLTCIGQKGRAIYAIFSFDSADGEVKLEPALNKFFEYFNPRENVPILCHKWAILEKIQTRDGMESLGAL